MIFSLPAVNFSRGWMPKPSIFQVLGSDFSASKGAFPKRSSSAYQVTFPSLSCRAASLWVSSTFETGQRRKRWCHHKNIPVNYWNYWCRMPCLWRFLKYCETNNRLENYLLGFSNLQNLLANLFRNLVLLRHSCRIVDHSGSMEGHGSCFWCCSLHEWINMSIQVAVKNKIKGHGWYCHCK